MAFRSPFADAVAAGAAGAAEVAGPSELAEAAEVALSELAEAAVAVVVQAGAADAVFRGEPAACAKRDCFPITLTKVDRDGRVRQGRPG